MEIVAFDHRGENATRYIPLFRRPIPASGRFARYSDLTTSVINSHKSSMKCLGK
jgi:hypothetical protein